MASTVRAISWPIRFSRGRDVCDTCCERGRVGRQRLGQAGALEQRADQLAAQVVGAAERREQQRQALPFGKIALEEAQRLAQRECEEAAQAAPVLGRRRLRLVEDLQFDRVAGIDQGRIADQGLAPALTAPSVRAAGRRSSR